MYECVLGEREHQILISPRVPKWLELALVLAIEMRVPWAVCTHFPFVVQVIVLGGKYTLVARVTVIFHALPT